MIIEILAIIGGLALMVSGLYLVAPKLFRTICSIPVAVWYSFAFLDRIARWWMSGTFVVGLIGGVFLGRAF